jgi:NAD(P)-dependent dehydrogenase (short-subunit alcohol dehydrogenase family)
MLPQTFFSLSASLGGVHLLCNNAGVGLAKLSWEHTTPDWDWVLGVNMWSIVHANRYFIPRMLKQSDRSRILNTASAAGLLSTPGMIAYNVSKHAVVTMSETLYHELKDLNANVSLILTLSFSLFHSSRLMSLSSVLLSSPLELQNLNEIAPKRL